MRRMVPVAEMQSCTKHLHEYGTKTSEAAPRICCRCCLCGAEPRAANVQDQKQPLDGAKAPLAGTEMLHADSQTSLMKSVP